MGYIITVTVYLIGWAVTGWLIAMRMLDSGARHTLESRRKWRAVYHESDPQQDEPLVKTDDKVLSLVLGYSAAMVWPVVLLILLVLRGMTTPTEKREALRREAEDRRAELEKLRRQARELGLPLD